jgi:hypothetical protein
VSAASVLVDHFEEGNIGAGISVELLQHFLGELDGHGPVLLFSQHLQYSEVNYLPHVGLNGLLYSACEVSEQLFGVYPRDPHVVFVGDGGEAVDGPQELRSDLFGRGGGEEGGDIKKIALWGGIG